ncbi:MAG: DUF262 domain-containing protein, partial [Nitrosomonas sp.]|nr:DUF262 domain-containing protein [Nitrosomonas sp.]
MSRNKKSKTPLSALRKHDTKEQNVMAIEGHQKNIRDLIMGDNMSFHIPIYQRTYTWQAKNEVDKLIDDIVEFEQEHEENS